jgi:hypothetical protein
MYNVLEHTVHVLRDLRLSDTHLIGNDTISEEELCIFHVPLSILTVKMETVYFSTS